jgi:Ig-like domain-containing protein
MFGFTKKTFFGVVLITSVILMTACNGQATPEEPTPDAEMIYTAAAQTVQAQLTQEALLNPTATNTMAPTNTPQPTSTLAGVPTLPLPGLVTPGSVQITLPAIATATLQAGPVADKAEWIANTPADYTELPNDVDYDIVWTLKNTGTTTWTTDYIYRFYAGDTLHQKSSYKLRKNVAPGESVDITVDGKTSGLKGEKSATWVITNKEGVNFYAFTITLKFTGSESTAVNPTDLPLKYLCCDNAPSGVEPTNVCKDWRDFDMGEATMKEACTAAGRPYNGPDVP